MDAQTIDLDAHRQVADDRRGHVHYVNHALGFALRFHRLEPAPTNTAMHRGRVDVMVPGMIVPCVVDMHGCTCDVAAELTATALEVFCNLTGYDDAHGTLLDAVWSALLAWHDTHDSSAYGGLCRHARPLDDSLAEILRRKRSA